MSPHCEDCTDGMKAGYYMDKTLNQECWGMTYCECPKGQALKRAHENHFHKQQKVKVDDFDDGEVPF